MTDASDLWYNALAAQRDLEEVARLARAERRDETTLLRELAQWSEGLTGAEQAEFVAEMLRRVVAEDAFWGYALEVLVQRCEKPAGATLLGHLGRPGHSEEWEDRVAIALLHMKVPDVDSMLLQFVRNRLQRETVRAPQQLALMYRTDLEAGLELGSEYFSRVLGRPPPPAHIENFVAASVRVLVQLDCLLVLSLLRRTSERSETSGERLRLLMVDVLADPPFHRWLSADCLMQLLHALRD